MADKYKNLVPTSLNTDLKSLGGMIRDYYRIKSKLRPGRVIPTVPLAKADPVGARSARAFWFGHSAVLLEIEGKRLLLDPMLGPASSPFPVFNSKRYSGPLPFKLDQLGDIDAVLISHNHFDHLDRDSIRKLMHRVGHFYVPSGVAAYLIKWGVPKEKISEHGWWEEFAFAGLKLACTPARHFSGRGLTDRDRSLWCSWVIAGEHVKVFFSGDSGYAPHFKDIGDKYGPFDLALMECGQYDERWKSIHMMPEETVQAHIDVRGDVLVPIHWGAFTLALHEWSDPIKRVVRAAAERGVTHATPRIGEPVAVGEVPAVPTAEWWLGL
ncbi:MBL fold metallo-hydrolase [Cohnella yongneupensis]|uniref:MBL fold metallo-hydrolase n=1 Tax=Cohnella yongneupensis TaxID=425006 RepID=A0ABW0R135_9BACL